MVLSTYQAVLLYQNYGFERACASTAKTATSPSPVKRMSAFATCMSQGLERFWNVPSNDQRIRAEIDLLPKRVM